MGHDREHQADQQQRGQCGHHKLQAGQDEDIEAVVDAELGVLGAERLRVEHEQHLRPIDVEPRAEHHADHRGNRHGHAAGMLRTEGLRDLDHIIVHTDAGAVRGGGAGANGEPCRDEAHDGGHQRVSGPQADLHAELRPHHRLEAELAVPHQIGDETRQAEEQADDNGECENHADEDLRPLPARLGRFACDTRHIGPAVAGARLVRRTGTGIVAIGFDIDDDRVIIGIGVGVFTVTVRIARIEIRIEHTEHIKEGHVSKSTDRCRVRPVFAGN